MVIWMESKVCTNCRLMQERHTKKNCPHIECYRCHERGHIGADCPNTECSYYRRMGHCKAKCPDLERKNCGQQGSKSDKRPSLPSSLANPGAEATDTASSPPTTLRASMPPSRRVEAPPNKIDPEATLSPPSTQEALVNSWEVVPNVVFPNLHHTICQLASRLATDPDVYLQRLPYHYMITGHGGPQRVAEMLLEWIDPHIRALEGRVLRTEELLSVQARQNNLWSPNGGYVDIVTDLRNNEYWRAYRGQSKGPAGRIKTHNRAILRGSRSTLHYHVIAQGQGYRAANWLKLWEVPKDAQLSTTSRAVALNVLEMTMCRAFQSLPGNTIEAYYGPNEDGRPSSNLGLNIVPPVLQGLSPGLSVRKSFSLGLEESPDSDISGWLQFRYEYGKKAERSNINFQQSLLRSSEFIVRFHDAVKCLQLSKSLCASESLPHKVLTDFELSNRLEDDLGPKGLPWVQPNGNIQARVGFALEDCLDTESENPRNPKMPLPRQFHDSGWNMTNCLIWAANPLRRDLTEMTQFSRSTNNSETGPLIWFNQSILQHSGLRVVLMCGRAVQSLVLPIGCEETRLRLEAGELPMFLDIEGAAFKRVYILIPNPVDAFLLRGWRKTHRISEALHFASAVTRTVGIRPYAGDNGCVLTKAIRDYMDEQKGIRAPLTLETLHPMTRLWLARRGFAKDEAISISQEKGGGSLSNSILVLLHVAPRQFQSAPTTFSMSSFRRSEKRHAPEFKISQAQLEAVRELCNQFNRKSHVDFGHASDDLIRGVRSREEGLDDDDVGEAEVLEREDLETSGVCVDTQETFIPVSEAPVVPWEKKKPRAGAGDRSFTIGDQTREQLLQGRKYLGNWKKALGIFSVTIHSCIELLLRLKERPTELIVKAEIKPPGQRHPPAWARETLATDPDSPLAFYVTYTRKAMETSSYVTSSLVRDIYKANSFVHWMEGEGATDIIKRPRQFVVVSSLTKTLPQGISQPGSFYTHDHITLTPAQEFDPRKKRKMDAS